MILDKKQHPDDSTYADAPPSYDDLQNSQGYPYSNGAGPSRGRPGLPTGRLSKSRRPKETASSSGPSSWFSFSSQKKGKEDVEATVLGLVRDLVRRPASAPGSGNVTAALGVLESCVQACEKHDVSLSSILQQKSIEGHTPLYWAIVNRPTPREEEEDEERGSDAVLFRLLAYTAPLMQSTISDMRHACLVVADNVLYQKLRSIPSVVPLSGTDAMLLTARDGEDADEDDLDVGKVFGDVVEVRDWRDDSTAFSVTFEIKMFQRRMRVSNEIGLEFIARGRLWSIVFFVIPAPADPSAPQPPSRQSRRQQRAARSLVSTLLGGDIAAPTFVSTVRPTALETARERRYAPGTWALSLGLMEHSPPAWLDGRLLVPDPAQSTQAQAHPPSMPPQSPSARSSVAGGSTPTLVPSIRESALYYSDSKMPGALPMPPQSSASSSSTYSSSTPSTPTAATSPSNNPFAALTRTLSQTRLSLNARPNVPQSNTRRQPKTKPKPTIALRLKAPAQLVAAPSPGSGLEQGAESSGRRKGLPTEVVASFEESLMGSSLQYDGCAYILPDGTLRAVLEARLAQPESECVIC